MAPVILITQSFFFYISGKCKTGFNSLGLGLDKKAEISTFGIE
jgi:hypothetical protein